MAVEISAELRRLVFDRANGRCEYCLLAQVLTGHRHQPDHIVPIQHDGPTSAENLALACIRCNRHKGPNVGSFDPETGQLVPFFNPRTQQWEDHFRIEGFLVQPLTPEARVTVKIFRLNDSLRVEERSQLIALGLYP
jgi:hypothetical protein